VGANGDSDDGMRDRVSPELALTVLARDKGCVAVTLGAAPAGCRGRLTLDHVKDQPRMGKRAPSDAGHLVSLCEGHHLENGWATSHRPELREYLRAVTA
jgi:hypothetical protein